MDSQLNLSDIPSEIITEFLLKLNLVDLQNFCKTSHAAMEYCKDDVFWKNKYQHDFPNSPSIKNLSWKERYKLVYSVPNSPISAGVSHFAIINDKNMLYMGGHCNSFDEYGRNYDYSKSLSNTPIFSRKVKSISCGNYFTGAVTDNGKVFFWGKKLHGLLGETKHMTVVEPVEFKIPGRAIKITCGPKTKETFDLSSFHRPGMETVILPMFAVILEDRSVFLRTTARIGKIRKNISMKLTIPTVPLKSSVLQTK